jgi:hypothetical protein
LNLEPPKKSATELLLYLWKIIDLPEISLEDLVYKISFELFLFPPEKAKKFIEKAITSKLLNFDEENITLSSRLNTTLQKWQEKRRKEISTKMAQEEKKFETIKEVSNNKSNGFNPLLHAFLDKGTLNRTVGVSENDFDFKTLDLNEGKVEGKISGSKDTPYKLSINCQDKELIHNCHDFEARRAPNKKFCKHLAKLFLLLKERDEPNACKLLEKISKNINAWEFLTS